MLQFNVLGAHKQCIYICMYIFGVLKCDKEHIEFAVRNFVFIAVFHYECGV